MLKQVSRNILKQPSLMRQADLHQPYTAPSEKSDVLFVTRTVTDQGCLVSSCGLPEGELKLLDTSPGPSEANMLSNDSTS